MGKVCGKLAGRASDINVKSSIAQHGDRGSKIDQYELRNRALEAAEKRQEQMSAQNRRDRKFARVSRPEDVPDPNADHVAINEQGYSEIVALRSNSTMKVFVTRVANQMGLEFVDEAKLVAWVPYFSGDKGNKKYAAVLTELDCMGKIPSHWCRPSLDSETQVRQLQKC